MPSTKASPCSDRPPTRIEFSLNDATDDASSTTEDSFIDINGLEQRLQPTRALTINAFQGSRHQLKAEKEYHHSMHTRQVAKSGYNVRVTETTPGPQSLLVPSSLIIDRQALAYSPLSSSKTLNRQSKEQCTSPGRSLRRKLRVDYKSPRGVVPSPRTPIPDDKARMLGLRNSMSHPNMEALYRESVHNRDALHRGSTARTTGHIVRAHSTMSPERRARESRLLVAHASSEHYTRSKSPMARSMKQGGEWIPLTGPTDQNGASSQDGLMQQSSASGRSLGLLKLSSTSLHSRLDHYKTNEERLIIKHNNSDHQPRECRRQSSAPNLSKHYSLKLPSESSDDTPIIRTCHQMPQRIHCTPKLLSSQVMLRLPMEHDLETSCPSSSHHHTASIHHVQRNQLNNLYGSHACSCCCRLLPDHGQCCQIPSSSQHEVKMPLSNKKGHWSSTDHVEHSGIDGEKNQKIVIPNVIYVSCHPDNTQRAYDPDQEKLDGNPIKLQRRRSMGLHNSRYREDLARASSHSSLESNMLLGRYLTGSQDSAAYYNSQRRKGSGSATTPFFSDGRSHSSKPQRRKHFGLAPTRDHHISKPTKFSGSAATFPSDIVFGPSHTPLPRRFSWGSVATPDKDPGRDLGNGRRRESLGPPSVITTSRRISLV